MAAAKTSRYKLKQEKGVLHIGGGRFFYPEEAYELTAKELAAYGHYFNEEKKASGKEDQDGEGNQAGSDGENKE